MQALMFHRGVFLGTGTVKDYSFLSLNRAASTADTVVLDYKDGRNVCTACLRPITSVRYQWQGDHVVMLDPAPPW
jgi:hypothetical protein